MDPGRPKQLTGAGVVALEFVVRAHSNQLIKLNTELSSAFAQVTGEMGDLRTSGTSTSYGSRPHSPIKLTPSQT